MCCTYQREMPAGCMWNISRVIYVGAKLILLAADHLTNSPNVLGRSNHPTLTAAHFSVNAASFIDLLNIYIHLYFVTKTATISNTRKSTH